MNYVYNHISNIYDIMPYEISNNKLISSYNIYNYFIKIIYNFTIVYIFLHNFLECYLNLQSKYAWF